jgi:hypothetical protein
LFVLKIIILFFYFYFMFNDLKNFEQNDFGMSDEDLEK